MSDPSEKELEDLNQELEVTEEEEESESEGDDEPEEEAAGEDGEEEVAAEEEVEPEKEEPAAELPSQMELLQLQLQQANEDRERWRKAHDELSGKVGGKIQRLQKELARLRGSEDAGDDADPGETEDERDTRLDRVERREVVRAIKEEVASFAGQVPAIISDTEVKSYLESAGVQARMKTIREMSDPDEAASSTRSLLTEALMAAVTKRQADGATRKQKQDATLRGKKALVAPIGGTKVKAMPGRAKDPGEMSETEVEEAMRAQGRRGF